MNRRQPLGRLALDRVRYAAELAEAPRGLYEEYLKAHSGYLIRRITDDRDLELAEDCCSRKVSDAGGRGGVCHARGGSGLGGGSGGAASSDAAVFRGENTGRALFV